MQPQDIVEEEEKRRVNALLQREKLIRRLRVVDQLCQRLPMSHRAAGAQAACTMLPSSQVTAGCPDPSCEASTGDPSRGAL